jgi:Ni/Fe-hydrogenase 1 B-type cytochrome subunit
MTTRVGALGGARDLFGRVQRVFARERGNFTWVYLWSAPIRAMHWIAAACILSLIVTGFYIARPYFATSGEASAHFLMGRVRFIHFTAAAVLVMTGIVRAYWLLVGNQFERLPALFPVTGKNISNLVKTAGSYLTFRPDKQPNFVGHNPMQQWSYTAVYVMAIVTVVTGFTLYGQSAPGSVIFRAFSWLPALLGGLQGIRVIHHLMTWAFILFIEMHVYFAIRSDYVERAGVVSSIITGGRYISTDHSYEDYDIAKVPSHPWPTGEHRAPGTGE